MKVPSGLTADVFQRALEALLPAGIPKRHAVLVGPGQPSPDPGVDILLVPVRPQTGTTWTPTSPTASAYLVPTLPRRATPDHPIPRRSDTRRPPCSWNKASTSSSSRISSGTPISGIIADVYAHVRLRLQRHALYLTDDDPDNPPAAAVVR